MDSDIAKRTSLSVIAVRLQSRSHRACLVAVHNGGLHEAPVSSAVKSVSKVFHHLH